MHPKAKYIGRFLFIHCLEFSILLPLTDGETASALAGSLRPLRKEPVDLASYPGGEAPEHVKPEQSWPLLALLSYSKCSCTTASGITFPLFSAMLSPEIPYTSMWLLSRGPILLFHFLTSILRPPLLPFHLFLLPFSSLCSYLAICLWIKISALVIKTNTIHSQIQ